MWQKLGKQVNFYRVHLLSFTLIPVLLAFIFWLSNGEFKIHFIDALFVSFSAVTGTGLSTIDLSSLTAWQQTIIVILELAGNQVFVSLIIVYIRRSFFRQHLGHIVDAELKRARIRRDCDTDFPSLHDMPEQSHEERLHQPQGRRWRRSENKASSPPRVNAGMVRRVDVAPRLINPMGMPSRVMTTNHTDPISSPATPTSVSHRFGRTGLRLRTTHRPSLKREDGPANLPQAEVGFGGFPGPRDLLSFSSRTLFPSLHRDFQRTLTIPRTATLIPQTHHRATRWSTDNLARPVGYLSFTANVHDNSQFHGLTEEQMIELGGVEYRALNALLWIVPVYYLGLLAISVLIVTPYMTLPRWRENFLPPQQHRKISPIWFSVFQVAGAWANTGMSLVDQNMIPFKTAYVLIVVLIICVLAGNTAFPIFFRFTIWLFSKTLSANSRTREALQFLLDHPRRCFITLFPSPHTWLLLFILVVLNLVTLAGDLILNTGNPATDTIPIGTRIALAFLSSAAVRSAGFQGVAVASLTPATQTLYIILMYIAIYPIAMSVRATNVYQERSLGIYPDGTDDDYAEDLEKPDDSQRVALWGKYLMRHMRKQLSFDIWWLALSLFLICIIERDNLMDTTKTAWFNIFALLFEIVSGYGTVGLSLGIPTANYSLSGAFHVLSKLIICAVMLRGRHRGLPIALDRAVMLPHEFLLRKPTMGEGRDLEQHLKHPESSAVDAASTPGSDEQQVSSTSKPSCDLPSLHSGLAILSSEAS